MKHLKSFNEAAADKVPQFSQKELIMQDIRKKADKRAAEELNSKLENSLRYQEMVEEMKDLKKELNQIYSDQENDPAVIDNPDNDNPVVQEYADRLMEVEEKIKKLNNKMLMLRQSKSATLK